MKHWATGEWKIKDLPDSYVDARDLFNFIKLNKMKAIEINISDIGFKRVDNIDKKEARYKLADVSYPCIVGKDMDNPSNKPYRLIDGRHRILKTIDVGKDIISCFVFKEKDIIKFLKYI